MGYRVALFAWSYI